MQAKGLYGRGKNMDEEICCYFIRVTEKLKKIEDEEEKGCLGFHVFFFVFFLFFIMVSFFTFFPDPEMFVLNFIFWETLFIIKINF